MTRKRMLALSVRQPFAEQIVRGTKTIEYRKTATRIRERVYIYASKGARPVDDWKGMNCQPGDLAVGVLVGTVEVVDCAGTARDYQWRLANPRRLTKKLKPKNRPQPVWFHPF